jgi:hypothetical protein
MEVPGPMRTLLTIAAVLTLAACASPAAPTPMPEAPSADPTPSPAVSSAATSGCSVGSGTCLGPLTAGTYTTTTFETPLRYYVSDGWANYEDLPGNFLLVPPGADLAGVDAGTADYIGVYDGVAAASADCVEAPQDDVDTTPEAIAAWLTGLEGIDSSTPEPAVIGFLEGVVLDLRLTDGYSEGCPYPGYEGVAMVPMIIGDGTSPAGLHHVVIGDSTTRLYLLGGRMNRTIAIEITDLPGGADMDALDAVAHTFRFEHDH